MESPLPLLGDQHRGGHQESAAAHAQYTGLTRASPPGMGQTAEFRRGVATQTDAGFRTDRGARTFLSSVSYVRVISTIVDIFPGNKKGSNSAHPENITTAPL